MLSAAHQQGGDDDSYDLDWHLDSSHPHLQFIFSSRAPRETFTFEIWSYFHPMNSYPFTYASFKTQCRSLLGESPVEWIPSEARLMHNPARSCDTMRANRSPSSISVCCMRWRLQLAVLEVSVWERGGGDWLHCELTSNRTETGWASRGSGNNSIGFVWTWIFYHVMPRRGSLQMNCRLLPSGWTDPSPPAPQGKKHPQSPKTHPS